MSKFYYQGKIQQENFLTSNDIFLRSIYGKYQLMILEAVSFILFGVLSLVIYYFDLNSIINITDIYGKFLGAILVFLSVINLSVYYFIIKKRYGVVLKVKSYIYLVIGLILLILPINFLAVIYRLIAAVFLLIGFFTFIRREEVTLLNKVISLILAGIGVFFLFSGSFSHYADLIFFGLSIVFGCYLLYYGIRFRRSLKAYEDEQKGFTDYRIIQ